MKRSTKPQVKRRVRQARVRARVRGTVERPRLNVFRSLTGMSAQIIDDAAGRTLVSAGSQKIDPKKYDVGERSGKTALAYALGLAVAEAAKVKQINEVVFDRAGYKYHGRVRAVAEGARAGGLQF